MLFARARANELQVRKGIKSKNFTDVTMTAPLAFTHRKITWVGVIPRRLAAFSTAASTGPPGKVVIDLKDIFYSVSYRETGEIRTQDFHKPL